MKRLATIVFNFSPEGLSRTVAYDVITLYDGTGNAVDERVEERVLNPVADAAEITAAVGEMNLSLLAGKTAADAQITTLTADLEAATTAKDEAEKRAAEYAAELAALKLAEPIPAEA